MSYILIIAEKPNAAQKIADALADDEPTKETEGGASYYRLTRHGQEIVVVPAVGHLFFLSQKGKGWDYPVFDLEWVPTTKNKENYWAKKYFLNIQRLAPQADGFIAACDYDIEGCLPFSEKILVKSCGTVEMKNVGDVVEGALLREKTKTWNGFEYCVPSKKMFIPCINKKNAYLEFCEIKKLMRRKADKMILELTTETGRKIHISKNHPLFVLAENGIVVKKADCVQIGDYLPVAKDLSFIESTMTHIDIIEEIEKRQKTAGYYVYGARGILLAMPAEVSRLVNIPRKTALGWRFYDRMPLWAYLKLETDKKQRAFLKIGPKKAKERIPVIIPLGRDLGRLAGYYLAEGCTDTGGFVGMYFAEKETAFVEDVESILFRLFGIFPKKRLRKQIKGAYGTGRCWEIGTKSSAVRFLFKDVFNLGRNAYEKALPSFVFSTPVEFLKNIIDAYLAGDGSLFKTRDRYVISASSKSAGLIDGLHLLLMKIGIRASLMYDKKRKMHFLNIGVRDQIRKLISHEIDTLVTTKRLEKELAERRPMEGKRDAFRLLPNFILSGCTVDCQTRRNMESGERTSVHSIQSLTPAAEKIVNSNMHFLRVTAVKEMKYTSPYLYDIETETGSFMHGNGVISHNSTIAYNIITFICGAADGKRMKFSTLTKPDIEEAYENASPHLDFPQIEAGLTRHTLDFLWGINASRALTLSLRDAGGYKTLSTGRVQGPTLNMLEKRQKEIEKFVPTPFWEVWLHGKLSGQEIQALHEKGKFWEKVQASEAMGKAAGKKATVLSAEKTSYKQNPPVPFDLTTLQREAYAAFRYSPKQTLDIAQNLYEGALIPYPRTSSQKLPEKLGYKNIIERLYGQPAYTGLCEQLLKNPLQPNEGKKVDSAHPAIYPTGTKPQGLNIYQAKLYDMIVRRFLAVFAEPAVREAAKVNIEAGGERFVAEGVRTLTPGWLDFYPYAKLKEVMLPEANAGDGVAEPKVTVADKETQPPKRFTQATILKEMEALGIGTKSTRAQILQTLYDRGYIEDKTIIVTKLGRSIIEALEKYCAPIVSVDLTKKFEEEMVAIQEGKRKREDVVAEAAGTLKTTLEEMKKNQLLVGKEILEAVRETIKKESIIATCGVCGGDLTIRMSRAGKRFVGCTGYPKCTETFSLPHQGTIKPLDEKCGTCSFNVVSVRQFRKRPWKLCIRCGFVKNAKKADAESEKTEEKQGDTTAED